MRMFQLKSEGLARSLPSAAAIQQGGFSQHGPALQKLLVCPGYIKRLAVITSRKRRKSINPVLPRVRLTPHEYVKVSLAEGNSDGASDVVHFESRRGCVALHILQELQVGLMPEPLSEACLARAVVDEEFVASYGLGFWHSRSTLLLMGSRWRCVFR